MEAPAPSRRPIGTVLLGALWILWGGLLLYRSLGGSSVIVLSEMHWSFPLLELRLIGTAFLVTGVGMFLRQRWPWRLALVVCSFTIASNLLQLQLALLISFGSGGYFGVDPWQFLPIVIQLSMLGLTFLYLTRAAVRRFFTTTDLELRQPMLVGGSLALIHTVAWWL